MGPLTGASRPSTVSGLGSARAFIAPGRYLQGPGLLDDIGAVTAVRHHQAVVLVDAALVEVLGPRLRDSFAQANVRIRLVGFAGEVTAEAIGALAAEHRDARASAVVAVGGGKTLDTGKGIARELGLAVLTVPTIASNDGPTSRVIATYDDAHRLVATPAMTMNPEAVVVDTEVIAAAPVRFLLSGIGDAIAKRYEAAACRRGTGPTSNGGRPLLLPTAIAELCHRVLLADAADAVQAVEAGRVDASVEAVVEAVVLMSGLAFENGGLSLAHSMTRGLMQVDDARTALHGYHVAYGLLVQLVHEGADTEFAELREFYRRIGLPRSLDDLHTPRTDAVVDTIVGATMSSPHLPNCVPVPTARTLRDAIAVVEDAGP